MTESELNDIFKYADDTTLLVPEHTDTELEVEFNHIKADLLLDLTIIVFVHLIFILNF